MVQDFLSSIAEFLDYRKNPSSYQMCQAAVLDFGENCEAIFFILELSYHAPSDQVRTAAFAVLCLTMFDSWRAAQAVALSPNLVAAVAGGLAHEMPHVRIAAIQLAHAVSAASGREVHNIIPQLVATMQVALSGQPFDAITVAALDMLVSASFHCADVVAKTATWQFILAAVREDEGRHAWLPVEPLKVFSCGMLAINVLAGSQPEVDESEETALVQQEMGQLLAAGHFFSYLTAALEAAVERREWPISSAAFHSPCRLARLCQAIAQQWLALDSMPATLPLLARAVETCYPAGQADAVAESLTALLSLARADVGCLETLLGLQDFTSGLLHELTQNGDEHAGALSDYLQACSAELAHARSTRDVCLTYCQHAPALDHLSRCYARHACLNETITQEVARQVMASVPVGPAGSLDFSNQGDTLTFTQLADQLYGTPELLGFWPSLMEDIASARADAIAANEALNLPELDALVAAYENASEGSVTTGIAPDRLLTFVLPAFGLPVEDNAAVEEAFDEVKFEGPMLFKPMVNWIIALCIKLNAPQASA
eukprot:TRINITY_DN7616_c0_g1_i3.p1 TRINITY_DN7616_c0_g1~~TRINITY_DN7616_c0_g1_i3.p1  ORF type:complete len:545 (+),score=89.91 TRINITY_DN7616_c0_g1_i3:461-2095(+)